MVIMATNLTIVKSYYEHQRRCLTEDFPNGDLSTTLANLQLN